MRNLESAERKLRELLVDSYHGDELMITEAEESVLSSHERLSKEIKRADQIEDILVKVLTNQLTPSEINIVKASLNI